MQPVPEINRQGFFDALERYQAEAAEVETTLALLLVDIANINEVNLEHGYTVGDAVIGESYARLRTVSRHDDTIYRVGSHRFAFIIPALQTASFVALALNRVVATVGVPLGVGSVQAQVKVKIGVALDRDQDINGERLLMLCESSLHEAQRSGSEYVLKSTSQMESDQRELEAEFAKALEGNDFELYYQPKINMITGVPDQAEALLRWQLPERGFISPEIVIGMATAARASFALTKWIIHTAVRQLTEWESVAVAVNIPADLVSNRDLVSTVKDALAIWGVDKSRLILEITESAVIEDKTSGYDNLMELKEFGVHLAIDDFGTGYSSLSYFKDIPAHELKIDQSFVFEMLNNNQDYEIVKIIIAMAKVFNLRVVAEGIEDLETYTALKELGCDYGQGYYMARPMPADKFGEWLSEHAG
jgi:diguanylate cyclase (GGDEF)-like protein